MKLFFKRTKKFLKIVFKLLCFILGIVLFALLVDFGWIFMRYTAFKKDFQDSFPIYGNTKGFVPQGLTYSDGYNIVLQTSHNKDTKTNMLYVIDFSTGSLIKALTLKNMNGENIPEHIGGVATDNQRVWVTGDYQVYEYSLDEIVGTTNRDIACYQSGQVGTRGDFCYYGNGFLWIGDFYFPYFYEVPDKNPLLWAFNTSELNYQKPQYILSIPDKVQGMSLVDGKFYFSRSYTYLMNSKFSCYKDVLSKPYEVFKVNGFDVPYYRISEDDLIEEVVLPPMAEGFFYYDNSFFISFESNADRYRLAFPKIKNIIRYENRQVS